MIVIEERDLLNLIKWSRRYCDSRKTYVASSFNDILYGLYKKYPHLKREDKVDDCLMNEGEFFPWAQDGSYNKYTGYFDATKEKYEVNV